MRIATTIEELRSHLQGAGPSAPLALVPTMGNLHAGHLELVREARRRGPRVAVSLFVNRLQFAPHEDFDRYPRTLERDRALLEAQGVELIFAPDEKVLYPDPQVYVVEPPPIANELEGRFRPRFFHGVATIVLKLFHCVQPTLAVFGKKDYQQLLVVRGMVRQFNMPIEIVGGEIVREPDGLALSSRNGYLSPAERAEASALNRVLREVRERIANGAKDFASLGGEAMHTLDARGWKSDYVEVRRQQDLAVPAATDRELVVLAASRLGATRLIDNLELVV